MRHPSPVRLTICVLSVLTAALLGPTFVHGRPATGGPSHAFDTRPREILLDVRGSAQDAWTLRTTLQELTARRGLPCVFAAIDDRASLGSPTPWATLSFDLDSGERRSRSADGESPAPGPGLTLREGASGRLRLHRVLPRGASSAVTIETLATIAYTALEALAHEEAMRATERPAPLPRERGAPMPVREHAERAPTDLEAAPEMAPEPPATAKLAPPSLLATADTPPIVSPAPSAPRPPETNSDGLAAVARASAPAATGPSSPLLLSLASFTGYRTGNALTGDRRTEGAWGMGVAAVTAVPRWPLEPALGVGFGAWYGTGHDAFGSGPVNDGGPRPAAGPQIQGQAELRLTVVRQGRFSGSLGPFVTVSRATYDFGPANLMGPRPPGPSQGPPPNPSPDPNVSAGGAARVTHTDVSAGLAARVEAELGSRLALYLAFAGTTPITHRPGVSDGRLGTTSESGSAQGSSQPTTPRWNATAFAGLSIALVGEKSAF